jgi:hypothetical protein
MAGRNARCDIAVLRECPFSLNAAPLIEEDLLAHRLSPHIQCDGSMTGAFASNTGVGKCRGVTGPAAAERPFTISGPAAIATARNPQPITGYPDCEPSLDGDHANDPLDLGQLTYTDRLRLEKERLRRMAESLPVAGPQPAPAPTGRPTRPIPVLPIATGASEDTLRRQRNHAELLRQEAEDASRSRQECERALEAHRASHELWLRRTEMGIGSPGSGSRPASRSLTLDDLYTQQLAAAWAEEEVRRALESQHRAGHSHLDTLEDQLEVERAVWRDHYRTLRTAHANPRHGPPPSPLS